MHRLSDHFKYAGSLLGELDGLHDLPSEKPAGLALRRGRFAGQPVWFHEPRGAAAQLVRTDDGQDRFHPDDAIASLQLERYVDATRGASAGESRQLRNLYYRLKPLMPRALQLELQRVNARRRLRSVRFPAWPQDSTLTALCSALLAERMRAARLDSIPFIGFWPHDKAWAWCLTHDVDSEIGYRHFEAMATVEEQRGLRSSWYFVPERYALQVERLEALRQRGHEIGVHGLQHSGKLFSSRHEFEWRRDRINEYVRRWNVRGFRSPATYRNPDWLPELDVDYDSSFMDNATLEPQPGGVCAPFPFMLSERLTELPITLPMDHTLINILRQDVLAACRSKCDWIRSQNGMALSLFHPDYNTTPARLERYAALLDLLRSQDDAWYALPWEVADWWQRRRRSRLVADRGTWHVEGPAANDARIWSAHLDGRHVVLEVPGARAAAATTRARRAKS